MTRSKQPAEIRALEPRAAEPIALSVVVLALDEERNLPDCLDSVAGLANRTFVVDSGSTDRTREIAAERGARVVEHPFESHARQWRWALENLSPLDPWVLGLDADQRVTADLARELRELFRGSTRGPSGVAGFYVKRRQIFRGHWIRRGGYYPKYLLKLFRRDAVRLDDRDLIEHHFYVDGPVAKLGHDLVEDNRKESDIGFWIAKHARYAALQAREEFSRDAATPPIAPSWRGTPDQRTLWLKGRWARLPLYLRPALYFGYRYVLRLGFLDGREGFVFHALQAFWYRLLVDIHLDDLRHPERGSRHDR